MFIKIFKGPLPILLLANYEEIMGHEMLPNRSIPAHEESAHCYVKDHEKITTMGITLFKTFSNIFSVKVIYR